MIEASLPPTLFVRKETLKGGEDSFGLLVLATSNITHWTKMVVRSEEIGGKNGSEE